MNSNTNTFSKESPIGKANAIIDEMNEEMAKMHVKLAAVSFATSFMVTMCVIAHTLSKKAGI